LIQLDGRQILQRSVHRRRASIRSEAGGWGLGQLGRMMVSFVLWLAVGQLSTSFAQAPGMLRLGQPDRVLDGDYSRIISVRELADDRVLFTDERENRLLVGDFQSGRVTTISRVGRGPGEYSQVGRLWPLPGDTTAMADRGSRRWLLLRGSTVVATLPPDTPSPQAASGYGRVLEGISWHGEGLASSYPTTGSGIAGQLVAVRFSRNGGTLDTVTAAVKRLNERAAVPTTVEPLRSSTARPPGRRPVYSIPFEAVDHVIMFPDGTIAVVRSGPYQVEWCLKSAPCQSGPILSERDEPMTREKQGVFLAWLTSTAGWPPTNDLGATADWPVVVPAFIRPPAGLDQSPLVALPDGRLLVWRTPDTERREGRYDLVDRRGRRVSEVRLPLGHRIVGVGRTSVYVAAADPDGLQRLQRHPWPPQGP